MLRNLVIILLSISVLTSCLAAKRIGEAVTPTPVSFVPNLPDVPMPPNFIADGNTSSFFDSAEGRIAEINAEGFAEVEDVQGFYQKTLPQFGWKQVGPFLYKKEGEMLTISAEKGKSMTTIKYQLRPSV